MMMVTMTDTNNIENLSIWWAKVRLEKYIDGEYYTSNDSFPRPVLVIDNKAFLVYRVTTRLQKGYEIKQLGVAGLSRPSAIRTDVIVSALPEDFLYKLGYLSDEDIEGFMEYLTAHPSIRTMKRYSKEQDE